MILISMKILSNKTSAHIRPILPAAFQKPVNRKAIGFLFYGKTG